MAEYLIAFDDDWVPDHTVEELQEKSRTLRPLMAEMKAAGVLIFTGGSFRRFLSAVDGRWCRETSNTRSPAARRGWTGPQPHAA